MSDHNRQDHIALAQDVLSDPAMEQALTWLIDLETATQEQHQAFVAWLADKTANQIAFNKAEAIWNSQLIRDAASPS